MAMSKKASGNSASSSDEEGDDHVAEGRDSFADLWVQERLSESIGARESSYVRGSQASGRSESSWKGVASGIRCSDVDIMNDDRSSTSSSIASGRSSTSSTNRTSSRFTAVSLPQAPPLPAAAPGGPPKAKAPSRRSSFVAAAAADAEEGLADGQEGPSEGRAPLRGSEEGRGSGGSGASRGERKSPHKAKGGAGALRASGGGALAAWKESPGDFTDSDDDDSDNDSGKTSVRIKRTAPPEASPPQPPPASATAGALAIVDVPKRGGESTSAEASSETAEVKKAEEEEEEEEAARVSLILAREAFEQQRYEEDRELFAARLRTGVNIVKISRQGVASFKTLLLTDGRTLAWAKAKPPAAKATIKGGAAAAAAGEDESEGSAAPDESEGPTPRRSSMASMSSLRSLAMSSLRRPSSSKSPPRSSNRRRSTLALGSERLDLRDLKAVLRGEDDVPNTERSDDPKETGALATEVLRLYAAKASNPGTGALLRSAGLCVSLLFGRRTLDLVADSRAARDALVAGFEQMLHVGPSGGRLVAVTFPAKGPAAEGPAAGAPLRLNLGACFRNEAVAAAGQSGGGGGGGSGEKRLAVDAVVPSGEAFKCGLRSGDRIVSLGGSDRSVMRLHHKSAAALFLATPRPFVVVVERVGAAPAAPATPSSADDPNAAAAPTATEE